MLDRSHDPVPLLLLRIWWDRMLLTISKRRAAGSRGAVVLGAAVLLICGALATVVVFRVPAPLALVAVLLSLWVGIASLFSP
jgi:hypothetical protein